MIDCCSALTSPTASGRMITGTSLSLTVMSNTSVTWTVCPEANALSSALHSTCVVSSTNPTIGNSSGEVSGSPLVSVAKIFGRAVGVPVG